METSPTIGRYRVVSALGSGAMGEVLRARDERLGRDVAIKRVKNVFGAMATVFQARFEAEARALAALAHPGVVQVFDLGVDNDTPFLVMELVEGPSLRGVINERGPLSAAATRALGIQLARALEAAHARGILHRDIKPGNVLQGPGGVWKLADFGVAHMPDSDMTMTGQFLGTPAYAAPESMALGQFSPASDVFALAVTLVEAVTGSKGRRDATIAEMIARAGEPVVLEGVPPDLAAVLAPALALQPERRPSAAAFAERLASAHALPPLARGTAASADRKLAVPDRTVAVPDGTVAVPDGTVAVPDGSVAESDETAMIAAGVRRPRFQRGRSVWSYVIGGVAAFVLVAAIVSTCSGRKGSSPAGRPGIGARELAAPTPGDDQPQDEPQAFAAPPRMDRRAAHEWRKIAEEVHRGKLGHALEKLYAFEDRFGESNESGRLRAWLERTERDYPHDD